MFLVNTEFLKRFRSSFWKILRSSFDENMIEGLEMTIANCSVYEGCHDYPLSSKKNIWMVGLS
jgi:hypothetical protein